MNIPLKNTLTGLIIGDAAGRTFDGMTREHIKACFKTTLIYPDPEPGLKNRIERWNKPGLYSSISQFAVINTLTFSRGRPDKKKYYDYYNKAAELHFFDTGLFREPDRCELFFLKEHSEPGFRPLAAPSVRIIPAVIPISLLLENPFDIIYNTVEMTARITTDSSTSAGAAILNLIIRNLADFPEAKVIDTAISSAALLKKTAEDSPSFIFNCGLNPDYFLRSVIDYTEIFEIIQNITNPSDCETAICSFLNSRYSKTSIKKAVIEKPAALIPFVLHFLSFPADKNDSDTFISGLTAFGGKSSVSGAIGGAVSACKNGIIGEPLLLEGLVNRTRIQKLTDEIAAGRKTGNLFEDFIQNEKLMTAKEAEELQAKLKNKKTSAKKPEKEKQIKPDKIESLNKHVVESWTKEDKARWKKTGQKTIKS